jgi:hypothetical protein
MYFLFRKFKKYWHVQPIPSLVVLSDPGRPYMYIAGPKNAYMSMYSAESDSFNAFNSRNDCICMPVT